MLLLPLHKLPGMLKLLFETYWWIVSADIFFNCCLLCHEICCLSSQDDQAFVFGEWTDEAFTQGDDIMSVMLRIVSELTIRRSCDSSGTLSEVVLFTVNFWA